MSMLIDVYKRTVSSITLKTCEMRFFALFLFLAQMDAVKEGKGRLRFDFG